MNEIKITNTNGVLTVSSLQVAKDFGKEHRTVLRTIEELKLGVAQNCAAPPAKGLKSKVSDYFIETKYQHPQNKQWYKCYDITRDGFSLLVMGFTGQKALEWKIKYIEAFNSMERQLININSDIEKIVTKVLDERIEIIIDKTLDKKFRIFAKETEKNSKRIIIEAVSETAKSLVTYFDFLIKILNNLC